MIRRAHRLLLLPLLLLRDEFCPSASRRGGLVPGLALLWDAVRPGGARPPLLLRFDTADAPDLDLGGGARAFLSPRCLALDAFEVLMLDFVRPGAFF
eukprot:CAMPEP_0198122248 /NCGR_PEP_ID=MMETSP1442-20131203/34264_1 /TAXON_ID= /ORGANISM="Craspedostauros australis, Strain CCMP3328" /LENGTH=96 /DNA_ID=CAMNT_0043781229 /DNA_START=420 /DNA_END=707 /DNA_ORIENTATION=-